MSTTEPGNLSARPPIRCFISYARDDNASLSFVDEFKDSLSHLTYANSGRRLEIFVDHDSIGWGDDWREQIRDSIDTALVFIPLVTLQYLDRPMCREELQLFVDGAKKIGVTDLFLPVVVLGHGQITEQSSDPVARMIAARQYMDLKRAVIEGPGSATWRAVLLDLSEALVAAVDKAEQRLQEVVQPGSAPAGPQDLSAETVVDESPGLYEIMEQVNEDGSRLAHLLNEFILLMGEFQAKMTPLSEEIKGADHARGRAVLARMAESISDTADRMGSVGTELEAVTIRVDGALRAALTLATEAGSDELRDSLRRSLLGADGNNFAELGGVVDVTTVVLEQMRGAEVLSVPMRTALRPLRKGVTSFRSAMLTVRSWPELVSSSN